MRQLVSKTIEIANIRHFKSDCPTPPLLLPVLNPSKSLRNHTLPLVFLSVHFLKRISITRSIPYILIGNHVLVTLKAR